MTRPAFTLLVRNRIHESAPDHSIETISVGKLRRAADDMEALYEALEPLALLFGGGVNMNDPLSKWFTMAQLQEAADAMRRACGETE